MRSAGSEMTARGFGAGNPRVQVRQSCLGRPLSGLWCGIGWLLAGAVFIGLTQFLGGISQADAFESVFSTWAIAHGHLSCAYTPGSADGIPFIAPLYPLLSGGFAALIQIGHGVPFPTQTELGPHCSTAIAAMSQWSARSDALSTTTQLGYVSWAVLMGGLVALLRASGRGRCFWEPVTLLVVACVPPIFMAVQRFFHPEDLLAMGLALGGLACVRRGYWVWTGVLFGLAITSQQFSLLVVAPLVVLAPRNRRIGFAGAAMASAALVFVPLIAATSGRAMKAVTGPGYPSISGKSVLSAANFHGPILFGLSRALPVFLAVTLAWWAQRRLGEAILAPLPLISLIATSLTLRLVFEVNLFGYYFMALASLLVVLDVIRGRYRMETLGWIALVTPFDPLRWGDDPVSQALPIWSWQILLVGIAVVLASGPLIEAARKSAESGLFDGSPFRGSGPSGTYQPAHPAAVVDLKLPSAPPHWRAIR
jgi:hypothetical protein